jgi:hypothetical protein
MLSACAPHTNSITKPVEFLLTTNALPPFTRAKPVRVKTGSRRSPRIANLVAAEVLVRGPLMAKRKAGLTKQYWRARVCMVRK